jgi:hypothetical protein
MARLRPWPARADGGAEGEDQPLLLDPFRTVRFRTPAVRIRSSAGDAPRLPLDAQGLPLMAKYREGKSLSLPVLSSPLLSALAMALP